MYVGERVEKKETLRNSCWECKLIHPLWRTVGGVVLKKLKIDYRMTQQFHYWHIPRENHHSKNTCTPVTFISASQNFV